MQVRLHVHGRLSMRLISLTDKRKAAPAIPAKTERPSRITFNDLSQKTEK